MANKGANLILVARRVEKLNQVKENILRSNANIQVYVFPCDLTDGILFLLFLSPPFLLLFDIFTFHFSYLIRFSPIGFPFLSFPPLISFYSILISNKEKSRIELFNRITSTPLRVDILINNAGLGLRKPFTELGWENGAKTLIDLNVFI